MKIQIRGETGCLALLPKATKRGIKEDRQTEGENAFFPAVPQWT